MTPDQLAEIKGLAELKRWPTMKELGQYREAMKALVAEVERLSLIESNLVQEIVRTSFHTAEQVGADVAEMMPTIALMQTAEVERLRGNASEYRGYEADNALRESENLRKQIYDLRAIIERVKALHVATRVKRFYGSQGYDVDGLCNGCELPYPCPTIQALEGAE